MRRSSTNSSWACPGLSKRAIIATLPETVWVSFDVDALDPSLCPHTGTPVPGGLTYYQAIDLLDRAQRVAGRFSAST